MSYQKIIDLFTGAGKRKKELQEKLNSIKMRCVELNEESIKDLPAFDNNKGYVYVFFVDGEIVHIGKDEGKVLIEQVERYVKRQAERKISLYFTELLTPDTFLTILEFVNLLLQNNPNFNLELFKAEVKNIVKGKTKS